MMTPLQHDFQDAIMYLMQVHHPELMNRVSVADTSDLCDKFESLLKDASEREPLKGVFSD
jgi:hypothetical protein